MSSIFSGGPESETKRPNYTRPGGNFLGEGDFPNGAKGYGDLSGLGGYFGDVGLASMFPYQDMYNGLAQGPTRAQLGGNYFSQLGLGGTGAGYNATSGLARQAQGFGGQIGDTLGLQNNALAASNYYAQQLAPSIQGSNMQGMSGAGQQVMNAGMNFGADLSGIQQRAIAEGLPQVRASYSSRGLGTSGESARGEQDYVQRISDQMAQEAIQARLGGLGVAAQGANIAAGEAANFGNIGLGRGNLALQSSQMPMSVLNQMLQGQNLGLQGLGAAGQQQFQPLQLAGLGAGVWGQGMQFPLDYTNTLFAASRQPQNWLANFINGVPNVGNSGQAEGFLGIG
jgi:hypothetical protein